jgi:hypothetical protein
MDFYFVRIPVESFDESLLEQELVPETEEYDSVDSDDSQNVHFQISLYLRNERTELILLLEAVEQRLR